MLVARIGGCQGPLSAGGSHWTLADGGNLDVLESDATWVAAAVASQRRAPDGLPIIDLPYLVLMKLEASRAQDLADVSRMLGGTSEEELEPVRQVVRRLRATLKKIGVAELINAVPGRGYYVAWPVSSF